MKLLSFDELSDDAQCVVEDYFWENVEYDAADWGYYEFSECLDVLSKVDFAVDYSGNVICIYEEVEFDMTLTVDIDKFMGVISSYPYISNIPQVRTLGGRGIIVTFRIYPDYTVEVEQIEESGTGPDVTDSETEMLEKLLSDYVCGSEGGVFDDISDCALEAFDKLSNELYSRSSLSDIADANHNYFTEDGEDMHDSYDIPVAYLERGDVVRDSDKYYVVAKVEGDAVYGVLGDDHDDAKNRYLMSHPCEKLRGDTFHYVGHVDGEPLVEQDISVDELHFGSSIWDSGYMLTCDECGSSCFTVTTPGKYVAAPRARYPRREWSFRCRACGEEFITIGTVALRFITEPPPANDDRWFVFYTPQAAVGYIKSTCEKVVSESDGCTVFVGSGGDRWELYGDLFARRFASFDVYVASGITPQLADDGALITQDIDVDELLFGKPRTPETLFGSGDRSNDDVRILYAVGKWQGGRCYIPLGEHDSNFGTLDMYRLIVDTTFRMDDVAPPHLWSKLTVKDYVRALEEFEFYMYDIVLCQLFHVRGRHLVHHNVEYQGWRVEDFEACDDANLYPTMSRLGYVHVSRDLVLMPADLPPVVQDIESDALLFS